MPDAEAPRPLAPSTIAVTVLVLGLMLVPAAVGAFAAVAELAG
jgi:hypothetical protein